jgi:hypothetical protein
MSEFLSRLEPGHLIGLTAVVGAFTCGMVAIVMGIRLGLRSVELTTALKQDMVDRGMTAEEIRIVMEAGSGCSPQHGKHRKQPMVAEV